MCLLSTVHYAVPWTTRPSFLFIKEGLPESLTVNPQYILSSLTYWFVHLVGHNNSPTALHFDPSNDPISHESSLVLAIMSFIYCTIFLLLFITLGRNIFSCIFWIKKQMYYSLPTTVSVVYSDPLVTPSTPELEPKSALEIRQSSGTNPKELYVPSANVACLSNQVTETPADLTEPSNTVSESLIDILNELDSLSAKFTQASKESSEAAKLPDNEPESALLSSNFAKTDPQTPSESIECCTSTIPKKSVDCSNELETLSLILQTDTESLSKSTEGLITEPVLNTLQTNTSSRHFSESQTAEVECVLSAELSTEPLEPEDSNEMTANKDIVPVTASPMDDMISKYLEL
ncbi:hypothetical protein J3Q64DRAFT_1868988 [Phycomyces blakesleeanus]|uniref:Uncharacterized protein n=1 Tax=Phycomyces blakesleeanus TaxID=4837 RepID=A0ABR3BCQ4_PHYBL